MNKILLIILFSFASSYSFSQSIKEHEKSIIIDTLITVWPVPKGTPLPPINIEGKRLRCYGKDNKGLRCKSYTNSIIGLCKKHEPKFEPPRITTH